MLVNYNIIINVEIGAQKEFCLQFPFEIKQR